MNFKQLKQINSLLYPLKYPETVAQRCSVKKVFLELSQYSQENNCAGVSFLIKLQAKTLQLYLKRDSGRCFPVTIVKFLRTSFLQNTSSGCFWIFWCFHGGRLAFALQINLYNRDLCHEKVRSFKFWAKFGDNPLPEAATWYIL